MSADFPAWLVSFVDDDAAPAQRGCIQASVVGPHLVVVNDPSRVPDLDAELVYSSASGHLPVNGSKQEAVTGGAVQRARAFELRARAGHYEPVVSGALERETCRLKLELRVARRHIGAVQVFGNEAEVRLARKRRTHGICAER